MAISDSYSFSENRNKETHNGHTERSYGNVLSEIMSSAKDVMRSEVNLFITELRQLQPHITKHIAQAAMFGALAILSVLPFLAFLVIGLGELLDGRYWLSSLIVAVACAAIGIPMALSSIKKLKKEDFNFSQTKRSLLEAVEATKQKIEKVKTVSKGSMYESRSYN